MPLFSTPLSASFTPSHIIDNLVSSQERNQTVLQASNVVNTKFITQFEDADFAIDCTLPPLNWINDENVFPPTVSGTCEAPPNFDAEHSSEAQALNGISIPRNTKRSNLYALKALGTFCVEKYQSHRSFLLNQDSFDQLLFETRVFLFPGKDGTCLPAGFKDWEVEELKRLRHYLIEFIENYKSRKTQKDISPSTLKTYIRGIQRDFSSEWGYDIKLLTGPVFNHPKEGLFAVLDNKAREQQRLGRHVVSHNVLSREDLLKLYQPESLSRETPKGMQARLVFRIGILTAMDCQRLPLSRPRNSKKSHLHGIAVWVIEAAVGSDIGASKTSKDGWSAIGNKVPEIPVFDEPHEDGLINFYKDVDEYMNLRRAVDTGSERFFLAVNPRATDRREILRSQHSGKNTFISIVKSVCIAENIERCGHKNWVTTHGFRGTLATLLFQSVHSYSSVFLRTGHRDPK